ncbi:MAG: Inositol monophosphatase/fructose-1,6-bisphosphatase family protein [Candidatus Curtissbacteria bacterium GW2011_GWA1_40_9]|uniref:Inositol monophosphatase/fructose-1,6-bisphosphatase family protein n=1 Tax=Candidatus Curtissbacteria bacterium GW2011_GWA1_40_9 TaxID=1618408 RepID=A0A0G0TMT8_9BACT|nr:MAG: Inositol monophosphatase/fructose-1,6-bisphosphatase family protein [Candidatus Curtissbacteria bacterium GW2011_GWA1_40_9]
MKNLQLEADFFHFIAVAVRNLVSSADRNPAIAKHKREGDFSTQVDIDVENIIVSEIKKRFPNDHILAEETQSEVAIPKGRIWIIDPICGTNNIARGIKNFCTNIALADNKQLIASCVVDHSQNDYFWLVGGGKVYVNNTLFEPNYERFDVVVDVDFGALISVDENKKEKHNKFLRKLIAETGYYLISLNSSLGFAYTAIGKVDGFLTVENHPWDICASTFLIQQSGGIITDTFGKPWVLESTGAIAAKNEEIHKKLLSAYLNA